MTHELEINIFDKNLFFSDMDNFITRDFKILFSEIIADSEYQLSDNNILTISKNNKFISYNYHDKYSIFFNQSGNLELSDFTEITDLIKPKIEEFLRREIKMNIIIPLYTNY